jgi:hypothetical protein
MSFLRRRYPRTKPAGDAKKCVVVGFLKFVAQ